VHEYSNMHEMFYINADGQSLRDEYTYGALAHEFQHMIHWSLDPNEDNWLDEGLADLASFINGYDVGGWDYAFAEAPDLPLTFWPSGGDSGIHYGQAFLFTAYFLDRFGSEATQALVGHPANGLDSMDQVLEALGLSDPGGPLGADQVFRDLAVALLLLDSSVGDGRYALESYPQAPALGAEREYSTCPGGPDAFDVHQYGIDVLSIACEGTFELAFEAETLVQVLPVDPFDGDWAFWSNRGNYSDMRLTREFDLRQTDGPIELSYRVWYDIEEDWDYVYLEVSADEGQSWEILNTPSGTGRDPNGASYGWAYTGASGSADGPRWIEERIDLTAYAGQEILIRLEYVTDASVNGNGLLIDEVAIPALGYREGFEAGDGGWEAEGFVRLYNRLPQSFQVAVVEVGHETRVRPLELDETNQGRLDLTLGETYDQAYVIVIGTARHSWEVAPYRIEIRP
jgi:immune inhibitor A